MQQLEAKPLTAKLDASTELRARAFKKRFGRSPGLVALWVGDAAESEIYVTRKKQRAESLGIRAEILRFPAKVSPKKVAAEIARLNRSARVDGILLQRPLPAHFPVEDILYWIDPDKDVDCFHPENFGRLSLGLSGLKPCTPSAILALLEHYQVPVSGRRAVVVGRSSIVGRPMAELLISRDATVTVAHSKTQDLALVTRNAEILIVAAGKRGLIGREHVAKGATVIDVGIHRDAQGRLSGDVRSEELSGWASAVSPVPGGVGPLTISLLLQNTVQAAEMAAQKRKAKKK